MRHTLSPESLSPEKIKKILIIRLDHIGDAALSRPALAALHAHYPSAQIDLLVSSECAPLFEDSREIREIIPFQHSWFSRSYDRKKCWMEAQSLKNKLAAGQYDLGIDFRGDFRNILLMAFAGIPIRIGYGQTGGGFLLHHAPAFPKKEHQVQASFDLLKIFGIEAPRNLKNEPFTYSSSRKWHFWNHAGKKLDPEAPARIVIHPAAGSPAKQWPAENFSALIDKLTEERFGQIILIGTQEDKKLPVAANSGAVLDLRGELPLADLPILFDACDLFIGADSGPAHLAASQGTDVLVLFSGTNDPEIWHPWTNRLSIVRHPVSCAPCGAVICPLKHHDCMLKISVQEVFERAKNFLKRRNNLLKKSGMDRPARETAPI